MNITKLNPSGLAHYVIPAAVAVVFAVTGVAYLVASHAQSPTTVPAPGANPPMVVAKSDDRANSVSAASAAPTRYVKVRDNGTGPLNVAIYCSKAKYIYWRISKPGHTTPYINCGKHHRGFKVTISYWGDHWRSDNYKDIALLFNDNTSHFTIGLPNYKQ